MPPALLRLHQAALTIDGQSIVAPLSLSANKGDFIGIIGPNGAGKSSLLKLINGTQRLSSGEILLHQRSLAKLSARQRACKIASVSQVSPPVFALTVYQVAAMGLLPHKGWFDGNNSDDEQQIALALTQLGLQHKAQALVETLSGGELQRLYLARALVQQAELLLLDEPTNHLDVLYQHQILQLSRGLGKTVLACLHDLNLAARYCDKIALLHQGRLLAFGSPAEVLTAAQLSQVFQLPCEVSVHPVHGKLQITFFASGSAL
ncbi:MULTISPECIES: ABC transporter ATP-binding protein [unclassified Arsukibacterium]|uniref:ABC transporter ATP-binding protein n=1 Tax=unclassified Arsukibacterium TaxID=2635278 RepID=UPI000C46E6E7|nr:MULTISPECIES: ABC transporter ATP-binding protein [unclassified Arsukibacterium]MAA93526.1 ABC transporter [Rheinheimera sp.]MBM33510.1 ABC transporter [Rheinheimera sp.]